MNNVDLKIIRYCELVLCLICGCTFFLSCTEENPPPPIVTLSPITIDPTVTHQEMIGFGGAITWYNTWMTNSSKKNEIAQYLFTDLGADIIRFKNWYYPDNYPADKSTTNMTDDGSAAGFAATNELEQLAKTANPSVKTLLSSWGPPQSLKSNNSTRGNAEPTNTLKKDGDQFMYDEFGVYWNDVLDHVPFNPDYISIQNEPTWSTTGWTSCEWAASETATLPGYDQAFDAVAEQLALRTNPPIMVGPESANIGLSTGGNTFSTFADKIKDKAALGAYSYHPYNFNNSTTIGETTSLLNLVKSYSNKPNMMTEYSDNMDWLKTGLFINNTLTQGNTSAYIYWKMIWNTPTGTNPNVAMISVSQSGAYTITPYYYLIKHFSKYIDAGYKRIDVSAAQPALSVSAFINPAGTSATVVIINPQTTKVTISLAVTGKTILGLQADQSLENDTFNRLTDADAEKGISLLGKSITTIVLEIN